jgi:hypothetical protein
VTQLRGVVRAHSAWGVVAENECQPQAVPVADRLKEQLWARDCA